MATEYFKIAGGTVYDPANGIDGQVRDIWIVGGKIVAPPTDPEVRPTRVIDARGLVIMPGGVDMHCHIVGSKVNTARKMCPEQKRRGQAVHRTCNTRSGTMGSVPSTFATGYKYAGLGYTTAFDAAIPPLSARHAHEEFADTPCIDKGFYILMGNNHYLMRSIQQGEPEKVKALVGWLLTATKSYAAKIVNPGGVEMWKNRAAGNVETVDSLVDHFGVTPRQIIKSVAQAVDELKLPHSVHIHANNLGLPGNWTTTLETMKLLESHRGHLTHIQFHSYGGGAGDEDTFSSQVAPLADYVNAHPNLTVDVGQVVFGETTSMTGDGPVGYYLSKVYKSKWFSSDTECEAGCGIVPIEYKNTSLIHAWQWAIGLEWYLMVDDPWRVVMSTDHPNGGSFLAYPQIIRLLMDRTYRQDLLKTAPRKVREAERPCRPRSPVHFVGDRHHHPGRPGSNPRPQAQGPPRPRGRRRYHDLYTRLEPGDHVRAPAFRHQVGPDHRRTGRNPRGNLRQDAARRTRIRPRRRDGHQALVRRILLDPVAELSRRRRVAPRSSSDHD